MNWLCITIWAILILCIFSGLHRGMVRTAFSICSVIVTLLLGSVLNPYMSRFLTEKTPVYTMIQEKCEESITEKLEKKLNEQADKEEQNQFIESLPLPESFTKALIKNNNTEGYHHLLAQSFGEYLSYSIAGTAVGAVSLFLTFILVSILMSILGGLLEGIFSLPVLSLMNKAGGAVLGAVQGVFIVWCIFLMVTLFWDSAWARDAVNLAQQNDLTKFLYNNNVLADFLYYRNFL